MLLFWRRLGRKAGRARGRDGGSKPTGGGCVQRYMGPEFVQLMGDGGALRFFSRFIGARDAIYKKKMTFRTPLEASPRAQKTHAMYSVCVQTTQRTARLQR